MRANPAELEFHLRILGGDPTAPSELATALYESLVTKCIRRIGIQGDPVLIEEAVQDAFLAYVDTPTSYDPDKLSLQSYLLMAACRDYQNMQRQERRRTAPLLSLERDEMIIEDQFDQPMVLETILARIMTEQLWPIINAAFQDPDDRRVLILMLNGVRSWEVYCSALKLNNQPETVWKPQVKRIKDKIIKRLERIGESLHEEL